VAIKENPYNFLIMHAMGPNLAGVFGTAIAGGIMLVLLGVH
jgi:oxaloacetate decarboxylase beta subunit